MNERFKNSKAIVSHLPVHSGDGYGYGGGAIVTIDGVSIPIGEGSKAHEIAEEIAERWNAKPTVC